MKFLKRDDNALTLVDFDSEKIHFVYKSHSYAILFAVFALAIGAVAWLFGEEIKKIHISIYWFSFFLSGALFIGTINTLGTRCSLEIVGSKKTVKYSLAAIFQKLERNKDFNAFKEIRLYRPAASSGQAGRSAIIKELLKTTKGDELPLGTGVLGTYSKEKARELAQHISKMMSLVVIEEDSVEGKM